MMIGLIQAPKITVKLAGYSTQENPKGLYPHNYCYLFPIFNAHNTNR